MTRYKHGKSHSQTYGVWSTMKARCQNPNVLAWKNYGGRGIAVCERWQDFANFFEDMGDPPPGMTLDRIDNDGDYSPENCRWTSRRTQSLNRRAARMVTVRGQTKTVSEWADEVGLNFQTLWRRLDSGWDPEAAVMTPLVKNRKGIPRGELLRNHV